MDAARQDTCAEKLEQRAAWTNCSAPSLPRAQKRLEVFAPVGGEAAAHQRAFALISHLIEVNAHQLEAQVDEIGVQHVGLAVVADADKDTNEKKDPHQRAAHAHLAGEAQ